MAPQLQSQEAGCSGPSADRSQNSVPLDALADTIWALGSNQALYTWFIYNHEHCVGTGSDLKTGVFIGCECLKTYQTSPGSSVMTRAGLSIPSFGLKVKLVKGERNQRVGQQGNFNSSATTHMPSII